MVNRSALGRKGGISKERLVVRSCCLDIALGDMTSIIKTMDNPR
jgi:hypothetical protein